METASRILGRFASALRYEDLSPEVIRYSKHLLLDTLGVALGGYLSEPSYITRSMVRELGGRPEATIIGSGEKTSCSLAGFANGVMVRYLDFMDIYFNLEMCHPSENIPTALAVGERQHSSGKELLLAMFLGFELQGRFADTFACYKAGWHHTTMGGYVTPIVAGKLLGLNEEQMLNAMGIGGCTNHTASFFTPHIQVSMIKAIAYALATQRGIEAALMAQKGMTGPENVVEMLNELIGGNADLTPTIKGAEKPRILECGLKPYASEFMSHTPIEAMFNILEEHPLNPEDIESMHLKTYGNALLIAREEYFKPENRETADHSIPYCLAIGLIEGDVGPDQFAHEQWKDPKVLELMSKIKVSLDPELDKLYPSSRPADLEIRTKKGQVYRNRVDYPRGAPHNPMSDEEVRAKFRKLAKPLMSEKQVEKIIGTVDSIEQVDDVCQLMALLSV